MSSPELHARASELFLELRRLPRGERRRAALEAATRGDERLREEVATLLAHDVEEGASGPEERAPDWPARIGPYHLLERIGSGGSGHVFLARQDEPIQRRVALSRGTPLDGAQRSELEKLGYGGRRARRRGSWRIPRAPQRVDRERSSPRGPTW